LGIQQLSIRSAVGKTFEELIDRNIWHDSFKVEEFRSLAVVILIRYSREHDLVSKGFAIKPTANSR
jgi:hypothetical protein